MRSALFILNKHGKFIDIDSRNTKAINRGRILDVDEAFDSFLQAKPLLEEIAITIPLTLTTFLEMLPSIIALSKELKVTLIASSYFRTLLPSNIQLQERVEDTKSNVPILDLSYPPAIHRTATNGNPSINAIESFCKALGVDAAEAVEETSVFIKSLASFNMKKRIIISTGTNQFTEIPLAIPLEIKKLMTEYKVVATSKTLVKGITVLRHKELVNLIDIISDSSLTIGSSSWLNYLAGYLGIPSIWISGPTTGKLESYLFKEATFLPFSIRKDDCSKSCYFIKNETFCDIKARCLLTINSNKLKCKIKETLCLK